MKNPATIIWNNALKSTFYTLAIASLSLFSILPSSAHAADKGKSHSPVEIKYVGSVDEKPVFQIRLDNNENEDVYLTLNDENGNLIYSDVVKDKKYVKNIQLENIDGNTFKMNLILRTKKSFESQSFQINKNIRFVENVEVTKVK